MDRLNPEALELNAIIKKTNQTAYDLLSDKGRAIYYPRRGVLKQGAEAKGKKINATISMAIEDDGSGMASGMESLGIYTDGFGLIAKYALGASVLVLLLAPLLKRWMGKVH